MQPSTHGRWDFSKLHCEPSFPPLGIEPSLRVTFNRPSCYRPTLLKTRTALKQWRFRVAVFFRGFWILASQKTRWNLISCRFLCHIEVVKEEKLYSQQKNNYKNAIDDKGGIVFGAFFKIFTSQHGSSDGAR